MFEFRKLLVPFYSGFAFNRFIKKKYSRAIPLFMRIIYLDSGHPNLRYIYSCLGRCFLEVGEYNEALKTLSKSYDLYNENLSLLDNFGLKEYSQLLKSYIKILTYFNMMEKAEKIRKEFNEIDQVINRFTESSQYEKRK